MENIGITHYKFSGLIASKNENERLAINEEKRK